VYGRGIAMESNTQNTVWDLEPHTAAKHKILERYLQAWMPILSKWHSGLNYIDGFAGPGIYSKGEEGSPLVALRTAVEHEAQLAGVRFLFVECRADRAATLKKVLREHFPSLPKDFECEVICGEFADVMNKILDDLETKGKTLAPTFVFIDPFGMKGFPMNLVARILKCPKCEALVTFMEGFITRFTDELRAPIYDDLFGTSEWRKVNEMESPEERKNFLLGLYQNQLKKIPCFVRSFEMKDTRGRTIYYLVYATKHEKGMEVMKEAMWGIDPTGAYKFSDRTNPGQTFILDFTNEVWWTKAAAQDIYNRFRGKTASTEAVKTFVVLETPWLFRKKPLVELEKQGKIKRVSRRMKKFTYPDGCEIAFA